MMNIREQHDNPDCYYQAEVLVNKHSEQCGCFATKIAAELWARTLRSRIMAADFIKTLRRPAGY
ncbi:MAG: hypothetical protein COW19_08345 [Zetaproteobacteria bacterium CG12_big_fil_rev_8_21_14_0_65_55_1124]|nr:MAG: hypothetical protein AUJ58_03685 [Zetaproteobacteria bacterium CG1_02_55_237]PIS20311.1 MAG: hypothetical protein COT53_00820 [Zetaproteobacteria bacterium CG08_land_8_20_14_0_20_55_17]PIW42462.1 MAG: hypothetical protein COW19_08345 [Zetaproteobacteria bacterium CG12_big_fil_rev_8_21_14_0_65_55_1124]PIY52313.1 MAG: hypothetical protein COZ01_07860 [Zetaproteobacteria bacterium CG_4_10_14_0_8_um_filter_55_43]PIZ37092.1 MAG: hypothetical protein COY36_09960 [Zetaproteobacteria bacterium 